MDTTKIVPMLSFALLAYANRETPLNFVGYVLLIASRIVNEKQKRVVAIVGMTLLLASLDDGTPALLLYVFLVDYALYLVGKDTKGVFAAVYQALSIGAGVGVVEATARMGLIGSWIASS
jgi:hypothetical protein